MSTVGALVLIGRRRASVSLSHGPALVSAQSFHSAFCVLRQMPDARSTDLRSTALQTVPTYLPLRPMAQNNCRMSRRFDGTAVHSVLVVVETNIHDWVLEYDIW